MVTIQTKATLAVKTAISAVNSTSLIALIMLAARSVGVHCCWSFELLLSVSIRATRSNFRTALLIGRDSRLGTVLVSTFISPVVIVDCWMAGVR